MSFLKQKVKFGSKGSFQWWGIITYIFLGLMAGSLIMSAIVVYNYTFRTLEDAHTIVLLNTETLVNNVNMEAYNKAIRSLDAKAKTTGFDRSIKNIFTFGYIPPATSTVVTTTPATSTAVYEQSPTTP